MNEKKFCKNCKKRLPERTLFSSLAGGEKVYEFEDGWYCENCALVKVKKARR